MSIQPAVLDALLAAGATAEMIVAAIKADAAEGEARKAAKRVKDAERQRRHRASRSVTRDGALVAVTPPSKEIPPKPPKETQPPEVSANADTPARDFFEEFWAVYPRREGDNPKKPAKLKFERAIRRGADPSAIIEAARQLAKAHPTPTPFVPQAVTWIGQERFNDVINGHHATGPPIDMSHLVKVTNLDPQWRRVQDKFKQQHGRSLNLSEFYAPKEWLG